MITAFRTPILPDRRAGWGSKFADFENNSRGNREQNITD
jgi:hypothetical protein